MCSSDNKLTHPHGVNNELHGCSFLLIYLVILYKIIEY